MKKKNSIVFWLLVFMLVFANSAYTFPNELLNTDSVLNTYLSLNEKSQTLYKSSEWVHSVILSEFKDRPFIQLEDWYHLDQEGKILEIYEWGSFGDDSTPSQESLYRNGFWVNFTNNKSWAAPTSVIDFTSGLRAALEDSDNNGIKIDQLNEIYNDFSTIKFSLENSDGIFDDVILFRQDIFLDKETGNPVGSRLYSIKKDGSEELEVTTTYRIETGVKPSDEIILQMQKSSNEIARISSNSAVNKLAAPRRYTYYQTKSKGQSVTVSGLSILSSKGIYPYTSYYSANMYTGTPSTILQAAGANWFSFQEYCNGTYNNIYINTTPSISYGVSN